MEPESPAPSPLATTLPKPTSFFHRLRNLDTTLSLHLHTITQPLPRSFLKTLELSGDGRFWFPIPLALLLSPLSSSSIRLRSLLTNLLIGSLLDLLLVGLIKHLVRRPRPVYNKGMHLVVALDHWSFPSGHSSRVCFVAAFLYLSAAAIGEALTQLRSSGIEFVHRWFGCDDGKAVNFVVSIVCLWSVATSVSRVLLGRHFVFDVIAGACLGVVEALLVFHFLNY